MLEKSPTSRPYRYTLLWSDLDLEEGIVTFHGHTTKGGKDRMIPLLPEVVSALASLTRLGDLVFMHRWREKVCAMPVDGKLGGDVYPWDGEGLSASPHALRHTFAATRLRGGVGMEKVQKWLGHSTISLTVDTYGHIVASDHVDEMAKMYRPARKPRLRVVGEDG